MLLFDICRIILFYYMGHLSYNYNKSLFV